MRKSILRSTLAAVTGLVALGAGRATYAATITIDGGTSSVVDGWEIAPQAGITVQASVDNQGNLDLIKTADFTSNSPLTIQFTQVDPPGDIGMYIATETITNSTGTNWTGFTFSLSSPASITGIPFIPPAGTGYNYLTVELNSSDTLATYTGSQASGSTSDWGGLTSDDQLNIDAPVAAPIDPTTFTLTEAPIAQSISSVPLPASAWQISAMLLGLGVFAARRKVSPVKA